ncbi:MAG: hypothetical protein J6Y53_05745, partial [Alphaproteobacteria bacterium]|nr:hypothetical protein [Alphaproteobacteria bacterium]
MADFRSKQELLDRFHELASISYECGSDSVKDEEMEDFIRRRNKYYAEHASEKAEIEELLHKYMENDPSVQDDRVFGNTLYNVEDDFKNRMLAIDAKIFDEPVSVPNLVNVVTEYGFNDENILKALDDKLKDENLGKRDREMYQAVRDVYDPKNKNRKGVEKLNDLINTEEDVKIAEDIARTFRYESNKEWPEMKKKLTRPEPEPQFETVMKPETVPNLVNVVTEYGFNDENILKALDDKLNDENLGKRDREMYQAVRDVYDPENKNRKGVEKLNDLINTEEDIKIAEDIARTFRYESNKEWPEMEKDIAVQVPVTVVTPGGNDGPDGPDGPGGTGGNGGNDGPDGPGI